MSGLHIHVCTVSVCLVSTHRLAEESTARAALVLNHAGPVVLTQNQQLDRVWGSHHLLLHHSSLAATQLWRENQTGFHKVTTYHWNQWGPSTVGAFGGPNNLTQQKSFDPILQVFIVFLTELFLDYKMRCSFNSWITMNPNPPEKRR